MKLKKGSNQYEYRKRLGLKPAVQRDIWFLLFVCAMALFLGTTLKRNNPDCMSDSIIKCTFFPVLTPVSNTRPEQVSAEENERRLDYAYAKLEIENIKREAEEPTARNIISYIATKWETEGTQKMFQAIHIAKMESGYKHTAVNYNCTYEKNGAIISTSCSPQDRGRAWSVDCGVFQLNFHGQICPAWTMEYRKNIDHAYGMYVRRGFQPWVAAQTLGYK